MSAARKLKVVVSGTCHGDALLKLLSTNQAFAAHAEALFVPNYSTAGGGFALAPPDDLHRALTGCRALIYHDIRDYAFPELLSRRPDMKAIRIPYVTSLIYWPTQGLEPFWLLRRGPTAYIPFPCLTLNRMLEEGLGAEEAFRAYRDMDLGEEKDLDLVLAGQLDYLRQKGAGTIFDFAAYTEANFRTRRLFHIVNHPSIDYFVMMAERILEELGFEGGVEAPQADPFGVQQTPVHPSVIRHFGLTWCTPDSLFTSFDRRFDFAGYLRLYIEAYRARLAGEPE